MYECLFEENQIGTMKLKNRLIVPAMSTRFVGERSEERRVGKEC